MRLGEGAQALDAPADKFRDWQENTNSIFWAARKSCASKWKSGSSVKKEPWLRGQHTRRETERIYTCAPPERVRRTVALLTKTYHGSRIIGQVLWPNSPCPVSALIRHLE